MAGPSRSDTTNATTGSTAGVSGDPAAHPTPESAGTATADRPDKPDRPDRPDKPDRPDRPDKADRPDHQQPDQGRDARQRDASLTTATTVGSLAVAVALSLLGMWVGAVACPQGSCTAAGQSVASYLPPVLPLVLWGIGALVARVRLFSGRSAAWVPLVAVVTMLISSGILATQLI